MRDEALLELERRSRDDASDLATRALLGAAYLRTGRADEGARVLRSVLAREPRHEAACALATAPGLLGGAFPTTDGGEHGGRRSALRGARRGAIARRIALPSAPLDAPLIDAAGTAFVRARDAIVVARRDGAVDALPIRARSIALSPLGLVVEDERTLARLDRDGARAWRRSLASEPGPATVTRDGRVVLGLAGEGLASFDLATGAEAGEIALAGDRFSRPVETEQGALFVASTREPPRDVGARATLSLVAIGRDGRAAETRREARTTAPLDAPAIGASSAFARVGDEVLIIGTGSAVRRCASSVALGSDGIARVVRDGALVGFDEHGRESWRGDPAGRYAGAELSLDAEDVLYAAREDRVVAIGRSGGYLWWCPIARPTGPAVAAGGVTLVASAEDRALFVIE